jgi:quercetin dioxygenase-like cupin family protein
LRIIRLYSGSDGESHMEEMEIPMDAGPLGRMSGQEAARSIAFLETESYYGFHTAPRRQYVIFLDPGVEIEVGSGQKREIQVGEILLAEDLTGRGHITRSLDGKPKRSAFIVLD